MEVLMKKGLYLSMVAAISAVLVSSTISYAKNEMITIGTAGITGVYYLTGSSLAKLINKKKKEYGIRAMVEPTGGSVFNINALMNGDLEFGVVQSDRQFQAVNGLENWKEKGPQKRLRSVFSIHPEAVTLAAAIDSGISTVQELKGKKVNIGNPGSGTRINAIHILDSNGIKYQKDISAENIKAPLAPGLVQDGKIDAFFYTVGHPNGAFKEATSGSRKVRFIPIPDVDDLLLKFPYYHKTSIPVAMYPGAANDKDVMTIGVKATLVTSSSTPDEVVYALTKELFENLEEFKKLHPAYSTLTKKSMLEGLYAPIHPGAMRYFKEVGLK